ncbi:MAG: S8 family serine peptidase [Phycisphaerae bacterium]|nr:S8 family serine peptidase [Phycisphaerae bacterium]
MRGSEHSPGLRAARTAKRFPFPPCSALLIAIATWSQAAADPIRWRNPGPEEGLPAQALHTTAARADALADLIESTKTAAPGATMRHVVVRLEGPVNRIEQGILGASGLRLLTYLGDHAWFAALDVHKPDLVAMAQTGELAEVRTIRREWKLHPRLASGQVPDWALVPEGPQADPGTPLAAEAASPEAATVAVYVLFHPDVPLRPTAVQVCGRHQARVRAEVASINALIVELPFGKIAGLADEDVVQWIEPPLPRMGDVNDGSRLLTQAGLVQAPAGPYGLDGTGINVLLYDAGTAHQGHVDFGGRLTVRDASGFSSHAQHVAGTIGGDGTASLGQYRGIAPGVRIESYGFEYDESGIFLYTNPGDIEADYREAIQVHGVHLANNSIGTNTARNGFPCDITGDYGVTSMLIDAIVTGSLGQPMRIAWANGNERALPRCGNLYHTTAPPAGAKNHIAVGAVNANDDSMTAFSSWGPTDDGRLRPDVCAPGCEVGGDRGITSTSGTDSYAVLCGTSMATPAVTGVCALLLQEWQTLWPELDLPRNSTLKAILTQTAVDLGPVGPDYQSGYGSVRAAEAVDLLRTRGVREESIEQSEARSFLVEIPPGTTELRATLAWDDPPGAVNTIPQLVNDLDLVAITPDGRTVHFPWTVDPAYPDQPAVRSQPDRVNNIEQVVVDQPAAGLWVIRVNGHTVPLGPQVFSLVTSPPMIGCSSAATVTLNAEAYTCGDAVRLTVNDCDLNAAPSAVEVAEARVWSTGDPAGVPLLLTETGPDTATFVGMMRLNEPGGLAASDGHVLTAEFFDADTGQGSSATPRAEVIIDCVAPVISDLAVAELSALTARITLRTDEPASVAVHWGTSCHELEQVSLAGGHGTEHSVPISGLLPGRTYLFAVHARDRAGNVTVDDQDGACHALATPAAPDYFAQHFLRGVVPLAYHSLEFTPDSSLDFYRPCLTPIDALPIDPAGGTWIKNSTLVRPLDGRKVMLYGVAYDSFWVNPSGSITFTNWDGAANDLTGHFTLPRIAPLTDWYSPAEDGRVSWRQFADRIAVTWEDVRDAATTRLSTFQAEMFFDGRLRMSWLEAGANDPVVGLSRGTGLPADFVESDLAGLSGCGPTRLTVEPSGSLSSRGAPGGPFEPMCGTYHLRNTAEPAAEVSWTAVAEAPWVTVTPASGILAAEQTVAVEVCVNDSAASLPAKDWSYATGVHFAEVGSGTSVSRDVQLAVIATRPPVARDVLVTTPVATAVTVTLTADDDGQPTAPGQLHYLLETPPTNGQLSGDLAGGTLLYTPSPGFAGVDQFTYRAHDGGESPGGGPSPPATVRIRLVAPPSLPADPDPPDGAEAVPIDLPALSFTGAEPTYRRAAILAAAYPTGVSSPYFTDTRDWLIASGRFHEVVILDAGKWTPALTDLLAFDGVIVWSNDQFDDPFTLGNVLADYIDSGGGVVVAVFANVSVRSYGSIMGRFLDEQYSCIHYPGGTLPALIDRPRQSLGDRFDPLHPVLTGVTEFDGGDRSFRVRSSYLSPGASFVAAWSDGAPLIAVREIGGVPRVDLALFPSSSRVSGDFWRATTDGGRILANALAYVCWHHGVATTYDIYWGTDNPPSTLACRSALDAACPMPEPLRYDMTYHWQVVAQNHTGQAAGPVWSFSTPPAAEAAIQDSVEPALDLTVPFGETALGTTRTETVTLCNPHPSTDLILEGVSGEFWTHYDQEFNSGSAEDWLPAATGTWEVTEGNYHARSDKANARIQSTYVGQRWADACVRVKTRRIGSPNNMAGVAVRASDDFNWATSAGSAYIVAISGTGRFYVARQSPGDLLFLANWQASPHLKSLVGVNELAVNFAGSRIEVYFNGLLAWTGTDDTLPHAGRIALLGFSDLPESRQTRHFFDDLYVSGPLPGTHTEEDLATGILPTAFGGSTVSGSHAVLPPQPITHEASSADARDECPLPFEFATWELEALAVQGTVAMPDPCTGFRLPVLPDGPWTLGPGECVELPVVFEPVAQGLAECGLRLEGNLANMPQAKVRLLGTGGPGYLQVLPADLGMVSGPEGGPFAPECVAYHLTNDGPIAVNWTSEVNVGWLSLESTAGSLGPGESIAVAVCLNPQATSLPPGDHPAEVVFRDTDALLSHPRPITLAVCALPPLPLMPDPPDGETDVSPEQPLAWNVGVPVPQTCHPFGTASISYSGREQLLANVITVSEPQTLHEFKVQLDFTGTAAIEFFVLESGPAQEPFVPVLTSTVQTSGIGKSLYGSGTMHIPLHPDRAYAVGVAWGQERIGFGLQHQSYPAAWPLGSVAGYLYGSAQAVPLGADARFWNGSALPMTLCVNPAGQVLYDVYLRPAGAAEFRVCEGAGEPVCNVPVALDFGTTHHWTVVARNACGQQVGPQWSFSTAPCSDDPPTVVRPPGGGPVLRLLHGLAGAFDQELVAGPGQPSPIECRVGGPAWLLVPFTRPVQAPAGLVPGAVRLTDPAGREVPIAGLSLEADQLTVTLAAAPAETVTVAFPGLADARDPTCMVLDTFCLHSLAGDVNADGKVNIFDLVTVRNALAYPVDAARFRCDVAADGVIDILDLMAIRSYLNTGISACEPPM